MAAVQKSEAGGSKGGGGSGPCKVDGVAVERFPAGMRILVVDDDNTCLRILEQMLRRCDYSVTICSQAMRALSLLRERKGCFDLVISDVHMPDMDGFKLLELIGLEMDLPVIMMSADKRTSTVMKGIKHGACNYLIKPVRLEELKNIWQHVIRKKRSENKDHEQSGGVEDPDRDKQEADDAEYASLVNEGADGNWKAQKKRRDAKEHEGDDERENDDLSTTKKPRVVWSIELHQQFVNAVDLLGFDKAVPKRILELMNVPGLTRENVASHLQKYRLYLKKLSTMAHPQGVLPNSFCGPVETSTKVIPFGRINFQSLAASGQIPPKVLGAMHAELLGQPSSVVLPDMQQPMLQPSLQGSECIPVEHGVAFSQPLRNCQSSSSMQFPPSEVTIENMSPGLGIWAPSHLSTVASTASFDELNNPQNSNILVQMLQQHRQLSLPALSEPSHVMNVQPPMIAPSQLSTGFELGKNPVSVSENTLLGPPMSNSYISGNISAPINEDSIFSAAASVVDCMLMSSQPNNGSMGMGQVVEGNLKCVTMPNASGPGSISFTVPSCFVPSDSSISWRVASPAPSQNPASILSGFMSSLCDTQISVTETTTHPDQVLGWNHGFVGRGSCIPSRFAVDDVEFPSDDPSRKMFSITTDNGSIVKQGTHLDIMGGSKVANTVLPHFPPGDFISVLSK